MSCENAQLRLSFGDSDLVFDSAILSIWLNWNALVFGSSVEGWTSVLDRSRWLFTSTMEALVKSMASTHARTAIVLGDVTWCLPAKGWVKVNSDGAHNPRNGYASCGVVIRDHTGP
ncbi:hypothetical protein V6N12_007314 [Hibiscus sabdariffa]|uniref:RNase H type-1 domain-containing protein n=1 Tax=Hibiscus sabdariffa TaxID=183260 RepID=A0ABR2F1D2_9ROSI